MSNPARAQARLLVVDDDADMRDLLREELDDEGFAVEVATGGRAAVERIKRGGIDLVVSDVKMPDLDGLDLLREIQAVAARPHVITITAFGSIDTAIRAVKLGAFDYITKPFELRELVATIDKALIERGPRGGTGEATTGTERLGELVGRSVAMKKILELIRRLEGSSAGVLITGEPGTGKRSIGRALHDHGPRRGRALVVIDCAHTEEAAIEARLLDHAGAPERDGTLFLDEVAALPARLQPLLLRLLDEGLPGPTGVLPPLPSRVIASSTTDLEMSVKSGSFREDLYYRLNIIHIHVPALRERPDDVLPLAEHFLAQAAGTAGKAARGFRDDARKLLLGYAFPGNARELVNLVQRAVALAAGPMITPDELPDSLRDRPPADRLNEAVSRGLTLSQLERQYIERVLAAEGGNKTRAALRLGLDRKTLYRKLDEYAAGSGEGEGST